MRKVTINILCVLIVAVLALSVLLPLYAAGYSFGTGLRAGFDSEKQGLDVATPIVVSFQPSYAEMLTPQSVTVTTTDGENLALIPERAALYVDSNYIPTYIYVVETVCGLASLVVFILLIIQFIRFIININKGEVFVERNVKRLRLFGWYLIVLALLTLGEGIVSDCYVHNLPVQIPGYSLTGGWEIPFTQTLIGLVSLLMAQVWARGLAMRREQELTI